LAITSFIANRFGATGMIIALGALALAIATRRLRPPANEPAANPPALRH
jgi:hypothetical protein